MGAASEQLAYDLRADASAIAVAGAGWILSEYAFKRQLAPVQCRWCDRDTSGNDALNAFDAAGRSLRWKSTGAADVLSGIDAFALIPLGMLGLDALGAARDGALRAWPVDAMIVVEAVALDAALNQVVKFSVGRERPFVHALSPGARAAAASVDDDLSFSSGHTSLAFALAVAAGVVAHERGYSVEPVIWAVGLSLAGSVGYLRMAADKHYATDVIVGALAGAAVGAAVPAIFHPRVGNASIGVSAGPNGVTIAVSLP